MNTLKTKTISCGAVLLLAALSATPAAAFRLYLQTGDGSGSVTGFTTAYECEASGSRCGLFDSNCAGYEVWLPNNSLAHANNTYYSGSSVSVHPASDLTTRICRYQQ